MDTKKINDFKNKVLEKNNGLLHLAPTWVTRSVLIPGRRLKLHPDDLFAKGADRGGISERWFSSIVPAESTSQVEDGSGDNEGLSCVVCGNEKMLLKEIIDVGGATILGDKVMSKWGGLKVMGRFFDSMSQLPYHIHLRDEHAKNIGMEGKPEAYYFPHQVNVVENNFPYTFFGLEPGTTREQIKKCLEGFEKGDNKILKYSKAYGLELGTGWLLPAGVLHAPGSLCTFEVSWAADTFSVWQSVIANDVHVDRSLLVKHVPEEEKNNIDYVLDLIDWDINTTPNFKEKFFLKPIIIENGNSKDYQEKWISYGKIDGIEAFSSKELTVFPGCKATIKDSGAYGLITIQGYGTINDVPIESTTIIRIDDITRDEYFVPYPTAIKGVTVENKSNEPLVMIKFFGPDCNDDMPRRE